MNIFTFIIVTMYWKGNNQRFALDIIAIATKMKILVATHKNNITTLSEKTFHVEVDGSNTSEEIKAQIQLKSGISPYRQSLYIHGKQVEAGKSISHYPLEKETIIHVVYRDLVIQGIFNVPKVYTCLLIFSRP